MHPNYNNHLVFEVLNMMAELLWMIDAQVRSKEIGYCTGTMSPVIICWHRVSLCDSRQERSNLVIRAYFEFKRGIVAAGLDTFNTMKPRQNGRHFADDIFKCTFLNENVWIPVKISLKYVPKGPINNIPALVQIMAWCRSGDKPLSETNDSWFTDAYIRHSASMS